MTDETGVFRKMADCPEIQGQRKDHDSWESGDYYYHKGTDCTYLFGSNDFFTSPIVGVIWLPDQRQLQEMCGHIGGQNCTCLNCLIVQFHKFWGVQIHVEGNREFECHEKKVEYNWPTFEQLWLKFYMERCKLYSFVVR